MPDKFGQAGIFTLNLPGPLMGGMGDTRSSSPRFKGGFSLLELLLVLSVIGVLAGIALPSLGATRRWLALHESKALFLDVSNACLASRIATGEWPEGLLSGEVSLNEADQRWRGAVAAFMDTPLIDNLLTDGYGNTNIRLVVDADNDHWIRSGELEGLKEAERPSDLWARVAVYSLDSQGHMAAKSW